MLKTLRLSALLVLFMGASFAVLAQPMGCQQLNFTVTDLGPCHYRLNASNLSVDCFNQATVLIQDGYFTAWTANSNAGWVVEQLSPTELLLTHANGPFPLGANWTIDFQFFVPGAAPTLLTVLWPELCLQEGCAVELPLEGCEGGSISGTVYEECDLLPYSDQPALPDWTVTLTDPDGNILASQQTDGQGGYAFFDLPKGNYIVKTTVLPGWTPNVPASGQYQVNLVTSEQAVRNFGNCEDCNCDQLEPVVVQDFIFDDTATYSLQIFNTGADCFHSLTITGDAGELVDGVALLPGWSIDQNGNVLVLTPPAPGLLPLGYYEPCRFRMAGIGTQQMTVSYSFGGAGQVTVCSRQPQFPNPPVPPPSGCCPQGSSPGPELVVNGDFSTNTAPATDYTFIPGANTLTPGQIAIRNQNQTYTSNNNWVCPGILGTTDQYLVVDGHTTGGQSAWRQIVTVQPGKEYVFCAFANNLVRPSRNFNDPMVELFITQGTPTNVVASSGPVTLTENPDLWVKISVPWTSTGTQCTLQIRSLSTQPDGNDFAVDNISFRECLPLMACVCDGNLVQNPGFSVGAAPGNLGFPGASANWTTASGSPQVDMNNGACDIVSMLMWGNQDLGESICQAVSFVPGNTYSISFYAQFNYTNPNLTTPYVLFEMKAATACSNPFTCTTNCTVIGVSPQITNTTGWVQITLPNWVAPATPNPLNWLLIRATNNTPNVPGNANTVSWGRIDNVCIRNVTPACDADFSVSVNCGNVTLTNTSTGTQPISVQWSNSGSGNTQQLQLPCGSHTYCMTITDATGCTSVECKTFTVSDITPPVAVCAPGVGVELDANCEFHVTAGLIDGGSTDDCQIQSMVVSPSVLTGCGNSVVTLTVTDWCGNMSTCTTGVQTGESVPPLLTCPPNISINGTTGPTGICSASYQPGNPTVADNCDPSPTVSISAPGSYVAGPNIITWTAQDDCGNTASCSQTVTVQCCSCPPGYSSGTNLVINGDFESGISAFTSDYSILSPICQPETYNVDASIPVSLMCNNWSALDHTTGSVTGKMFVADGSQAPASPYNKSAWKKQFSTAPNIKYNLCAYVNNLNEVTFDRPDPNVEAWIVDNAGNQVMIATTGLLPENPDVWVQLNATWTAPVSVNNPYSLEFRTSSTAFEGNNFALDDISFTACVPNCTADFTFTSDSCGRFSFYGMTSGNSPISYSWNFGDGGTSSLPNPNHQYINPGTYTVTLTIVDASGCTATYSTTVTVGTICDCEGSLLHNGSFSLGIIPGNLGGPGAATSWSPIYSPQVVTIDGFGQQGCMQMWGNEVVSEGIVQAVNFQRGCTYQIEAYAKSLNIGPAPVRIRMLAAAGANIVGHYTPEPLGPSCELIGTSASLGAAWQNVSFNWTVPNPPGGLPLTNFVVNVENNETVAHPDKISWVRLDSICIYKEGCPDPNDCAPEPFTHLGFGYEKGPFVAASCDSNTVITLPCPHPHQNFWFSGQFGCVGTSASTTNPVQWALWHNGLPTAYSGTVTASPYFGIPLSAAMFAAGGLYEIRLTGFCGTNRCFCNIKFEIPPCPVPCSCDDLPKAVAKGFYQTSYFKYCKVCFTPNELDDCDQVYWSVSPLDTTQFNPLGATSGNQSFCYNFPKSGTYTITMTVIRTQPDGTVCEAVYTRKVTVKCGGGGFDPTCDNSVLLNPEFGNGAEPDTLGVNGKSTDWVSTAAAPIVVQDTSLNDGWGIQLAGNNNAFDAIHTNALYCMEKDTGTITLRSMNKMEFVGQTMLFINFVRGDDYLPGDCDGDQCFEVACLSFPPGEENDFLEFEIPYDLREWDVKDSCGGTSAETINIRPVISIGNLLDNGQGGVNTHSRILIDNFCINGDGVVPVINPLPAADIRIYPNPTSGVLTVALPEPASSDMLFQVMDHTGRHLLEFTAKPGDRQHRIDASGLPAGMYFLQVRSGAGVRSVKKFVKQ